MAVRASMVTLIARLRLMAGAAGDGDATFTDDNLQDALDERRTDVVHYPLSAQTDLVDGAIVWKVFAADRAFWEDDASLSDLRGFALTPDVPDPFSGRWSFATSVNPPAVYVSGRYFDLHGTASAVCRNWAAIVAREFDFTMNSGPTQQTFNRSQKARQLITLSHEYARTASR